jgi:hypothetical protein
LIRLELFLSINSIEVRFMIKTQLAKAISIAVAGVALSVSASTASAHNMYNTFSATGPLATDGWTHIADTNGDGIGTGPESKGHLGLIVPWSGTTGGALPFGYTGSAHLNWAAAIHELGTSEISTADAIARYGLSAEIDTGAGAWKDGPNVTGWKHQTDLGLIKSDIDATIRLNLTTLGTFNNNFGVTVFKGMDTTTGDYSHHGGWNSASKPETTSNPFYAAGVGSGMEYLTHDATVDAVNYIEFFAEAGQVYTIALGGNGVGHWAQNVADYKLSITAVPVPGAVWLFGSALAGLVSFGRRKAA